MCMIEDKRYRKRKMDRKMSVLDVSVMGAPTVWYAGQPLKFSTRKTQALLIYLMAEGGAHSRAQLTILFWPESTAANGRAALRVALAQLREHLKAANEQVAYLTVERETLSFNFASHYEFDLQKVRQAFEEVS